MPQKYSRSEEIPNEAIQAQFVLANSVKFSARRFNYIQYRQISFGDLGWWLPLMRVFPVIGITPQKLRPVFSPRRVVEQQVVRVRIKRRFPGSLLEELGFLKAKYQEKTEYYGREVDLPEVIETYDQLGSFPLSEAPFMKLARVLDKSVEVWREDGGTGDHYHLFTAQPSGEILEPVK